MKTITLLLLLTCTFAYADIKIDTPALSEKAYQLLLTHEVNPAHYPENPNVLGPSGVTIGIGYDLGYVTKEEFYQDWGVHLAPHDMQRLEVCIGLHRNSATAILPSVSDIVIPLEIAEKVFKTVSVPKAIENTLRAFPEADQLPPDAFGALVSLVYNRGSNVYDNADCDRRKEMLEIRNLIAAGQYNEIPARIRSMKRLWKHAGLSNRREAEATLLETSISSNG